MRNSANDEVNCCLPKKKYTALTGLLLLSQVSALRDQCVQGLRSKDLLKEKLLFLFTKSLAT